MRIIIVFTFFIVLQLTTSHAQTYEGTIGNYPIFLELDIDYNSNRINAFYFYKSSLQNIHLDGTYEKSKLIMFERFSDIMEKKEFFTLIFNDENISGSWQNNDQILKVALTKTTTNIEAYKLENLKFFKDSISTYHKKELVWFKEKYSEKTLFRLGKGFTKSERKFMNQKLDSIHTTYAATQLNCYGSEIKIEVELVSNQYISFSEYSFISCGGSHPSHNISGYNFDYKNEIELGKLTDVYPNLKLYKGLEKKYLNDTDLQLECEYFTGGGALWDYYSWVFTKNGVTITPVFPYAMSSCSSGFSLTYKELEHNN